MTMRRLLTTALLLGSILSPAALAADDDVVKAALTDELERSIAKLRVEGLEAPYFIAYRVDETELLSVSASFGSLVSGRASRSRVLDVELRVGDYELDNTNFLTVAAVRARSGRSGGRAVLPLDADYRELRRQIWLATDAAYKGALEQLAQKKAVLQNKSLAEELSDFAAAERIETRSERAPAGGTQEELERLATRLSTIFRSQPAVFESRVSIVAGTTRTWFVNSEGTSFARTAPSARLVAEASTQAVDGIPLGDAYVAVADSVAALPPEDALAMEVEAVGSRLAALRDAELLDRYNGPVLFDGQAAAEVFAQLFAPKLLSRRTPLGGDERLSAFLAQQGASDFQDRLGARVLPRFLSLVDDPARTEHGEARLLGGFEIDDQGVPAASVSLVERGYLKRMLNGRTPVTGVERSTGHWRGGVAPSNLIVSSSVTMTDDELMAELLLLVEDRGAEFGVIVRRIGSSAAGGGRDPLASLFGGGGERGAAPAVVAFKVYPDGREVPVRNLEFSGFAASTFKEIIAVGDREIVYSLPFQPAKDLVSAFADRASRSGAAALPLVSVVVPPLLFEEVTLKKPTEEIPRLPVFPHPYFETAHN